MSNDAPQLLVSVRNHLSPTVRLRKGLTGAAAIVLAFYLLFGPRWEGDSSVLLVLLLLVAFVAFGYGWSALSQALMSWSRQVDIDFAKNEVRQTSASLMGRSKPFTIPFTKIAAFEVRVGAVEREGGDAEEATIELQDGQGRAMIKAGMFDNAKMAEQVRQRMIEAQAQAFQQERAG